MAGEETTTVAALLRLVRDVVRLSASGFSGFFKKKCVELGRRVSLLAHFLEEMMDSERIQENCALVASSFFNSGFADLSLALQVAKRLVFAANNFDNSKFTSVSMLLKCSFLCIIYNV